MNLPAFLGGQSQKIRDYRKRIDGIAGKIVEDLIELHDEMEALKTELKTVQEGCAPHDVQESREPVAALMLARRSSK